MKLTKEQYENFADNAFDLSLRIKALPYNKKMERILTSITIENYPTRVRMEDACKVWGVSMDDMLNKKVKIDFKFV